MELIIQRLDNHEAHITAVERIMVEVVHTISITPMVSPVLPAVNPSLSEMKPTSPLFITMEVSALHPQAETAVMGAEQIKDVVTCAGELSLDLGVEDGGVLVGEGEQVALPQSEDDLQQGG
jgi:hypothetical protein